MINKNEAQALELGLRVKFGREVFRVDHHTEVGDHSEPVLISDSGKRLVGTVFISHLLSYADTAFADQARMGGSTEASHDPAGLSTHPIPDVLLPHLEEAHIPDDDLQLLEAFELDLEI